MKLILITLAGLVVGMVVACMAEKAAVPPPNVFLISEDEAVALVEQHLQKIPAGDENCLFLLKQDLDGAPAAIKLEQGNWDVTWHPFQWTVYPITKTVKVNDYSPSQGVGPCP